MTMKQTGVRVAVALTVFVGILAVDARASEWERGYNVAANECNVMLTERDDDLSDTIDEANTKINAAHDVGYANGYDAGLSLGSDTMYDTIKDAFEQMCSRDIVMEVAGGVLICSPNAKEM